MPFCCLGKGDALFLPDKVSLTRHARKRARHHKCGDPGFLCLVCAVRTGMVSDKLAYHLRDPKFTLRARLTIEQAKQWTPTP